METGVNGRTNDEVAGLFASVCIEMYDSGRCGLVMRSKVILLLYHIVSYTLAI